MSDRISARLQRWAYVIRSFDFIVTTITDEHMHLAVTLSRLPNDVDEMEIASIDSFLDVHHSVVPMLQKIRQCNDKEMKKVCRMFPRTWHHTIVTGRPTWSTMVVFSGITVLLFRVSCGLNY